TRPHRRTANVNFGRKLTGFSIGGTWQISELVKSEQSFKHQNMESSMKNALELVRGLRRDEDGATLVEYTILLGIIVVAVIATITAVGTWVNNQWTTFNTQIQNPHREKGCWHGLFTDARSPEERRSRAQRSRYGVACRLVT